MTDKTGRPATPDNIRVRRSRIHGNGVFATRAIAKGSRIIEYLGERVSHEEADERYEHKPITDSHTFLFTVDDDTVVDAGVGGNAARWINHSCAPNCEAVIERGHIWIRALRRIEPGEELAYDYRIGRDADDPPDIDEIFRCHCGAPGCRGTMLIGRRRQPRPRRKK